MDFEQVVQTYEPELSQMMMNHGTKELSELESAAEVRYMWFLWQIAWVNVYLWPLVIEVLQSSVHELKIKAWSFCSCRNLQICLQSSIVRESAGVVVCVELALETKIVFYATSSATTQAIERFFFFGVCSCLLATSCRARDHACNLIIIIIIL